MSVKRTEPFSDTADMGGKKSYLKCCLLAEPEETNVVGESAQAAGTLDPR